MHFAMGTLAACVAGSCLFGWGLLRSKSTAYTGAALALGIMAFTYLVGLVLVERLMPHGHWGPGGGVRSLDTTSFAKEPGTTSVWLFVWWTVLIAITRFWTTRKERTPVSPNLLSWPVRCLATPFSWVLLMVAAALLGATIDKLGEHISTRDMLPDVISDLEEELGFDILSDARFTQLLLEDTYLFDNRLPRNALEGGIAPGHLGPLMARVSDRFSHATMGWRGKTSLSTGLILEKRSHEGRDDVRKIVYVHPGSSADEAGLARGQDIIVCRETDSAARVKECSSEVGQHHIVVVSQKDGFRKRLRLAFRELPGMSLPVHGVFSLGKQKIGYILFNEFSAESAAAFDRVARQMKEKGVTELVVDLRFNGGGSALAMSQVAGDILGPKERARPVATERHNSRYARGDGDMAFTRMMLISAQFRPSVFIQI